MENPVTLNVSQILTHDILKFIGGSIHFTLILLGIPRVGNTLKCLPILGICTGYIYRKEDRQLECKY